MLPTKSLVNVALVVGATKMISGADVKKLHVHKVNKRTMLNVIGLLLLTSNGNLPIAAGLLLLFLVLFLPAFFFCLPAVFASSLVLPLTGQVEIYVLSGPLSCSHRGPTNAGPC